MYGQSSLGDKVRNSLSPSVIATKSRLNDLQYCLDPGTLRGAVVAYDP